MNEKQRNILMAIEKLPVDDDGYVSIRQIASKIDTSELREDLNFLFENRYISSIDNTNYKLTQKGVFYLRVFTPLDERLTYYTSKIQSQLSCLIYLVGLLIIMVLVLLIKVF